MYSYPFFSFPYMRRYPSFRAGTQVQPMKRGNFSSASQSMQIEKNIPKEDSPKKGQSSKRTTERANNSNFLGNLFHQEERDDEDPFFEIFGLKLYYDDILLICLIFFLYQEDVKDQYLLFALVLLLLS